MVSRTIKYDNKEILKPLVKRYSAFGFLQTKFEKKSSKTQNDKGVLAPGRSSEYRMIEQILSVKIFLFVLRGLLENATYQISKF